MAVPVCWELDGVRGSKSNLKWRFHPVGAVAFCSVVVFRLWCRSAPRAGRRSPNLAGVRWPKVNEGGATPKMPLCALVRRERGILSDTQLSLQIASLREPVGSLGQASLFQGASVRATSPLLGACGNACLLASIFFPSFCGLFRFLM